MWNTNGFEINLHLIRHGKTKANEKKLYYGFSDVKLSENGKKELYLLKQEINYPKGDLFITSGLKRTIETLHIIYGEQNFLINENLKELNFGDFELKSYEELKNNKDYLIWIEDIEKNTIPNGETKYEFEKRVILGFSEIFEYSFKNSIKNIVVICHGGVIATFMQKTFIENKNFYDWIPSYGKGYTITFEKSNNIYYKKI